MTEGLTWHYLGSENQYYEYIMLHSVIVDLNHTSLTQYSLKWIKILVEAVYDAVLHDMNRLHIKEFAQPDNPNIFTKAENKKAL